VITGGDEMRRIGGGGGRRERAARVEGGLGAGAEPSATALP